MKKLHGLKNFWKVHINDESSTLAFYENINFSILCEIAKNCNNILEIGIGYGRAVKLLKFY